MNSYDLARGLHIIAVIAFMAGMLIAPRYLALWTEAQPGGELEKKMAASFAKLRSIILFPSVIAVWVLGAWLLFEFDRGKWGEPWLWAKLILVAIITGLHGFYIGAGRRLAKGERKHSAKFWRMMGELPFVIAIVVVLLATLEPHIG
jgi:putative membrane protein